ncbi:MAG: exodeoxyribonuclease VII small subunit [Campylobacterota bacterium]|nr:exodeoxyribonuclease VII small subunit [Campylobacterota bacterium]
MNNQTDDNIEQEIENISFESKIEEANKYLDKLVDPEITLSQSVEVYKQGMKELEDAQKMLDEAKLQFKVISDEI